MSVVKTPPSLKQPISEHRYIAEHNTILRAQVGSKAHGLNLEGTDDTDEMGICIPPPEFVIGLRHFEQYIYRSQPEGTRSGPGDLDLVVYSLQKYVRLAVKGNPTILGFLFLPWNDPKKYTTSTIGFQLINNREWFITKDAIRAYLGYMTAQKERLFGERGQKRVNRPELVEKYGYDTKYAMHVIRLGFQGNELVHGNISMPMREHERALCMDIRKGKVTLAEITDWYDALKEGLEKQLELSDLPDHAELAEVNRWLVSAHEGYWESCKNVQRKTPGE